MDVLATDLADYLVRKGVRVYEYHMWSTWLIALADSFPGDASYIRASCRAG